MTSKLSFFSFFNQEEILNKQPIKANPQITDRYNTIVQQVCMERIRDAEDTLDILKILSKTTLEKD